jgi:methenyltetrahydrofolate cyclohydrolase
VAGTAGAAGLGVTGMKLVNMTIAELLSELASDSPAPGGGSVAALAGAVAASLCEMAAGLTLGREKYRETWAAVEKAQAEARRLGTILRRLIDQDTEAYNMVVAARRLPKTTEADKAARDAAIQDAVGVAARVPTETLQSLVELSAVALLVAEKGNPGCITDTGTAAEMIAAGARAASWNVRVNLPDLRDLSTRERLGAEAASGLANVLETAGRVRAIVETHLTERSGS